MNTIPAERREAIIKKMLPPHNVSVSELAKIEGISRSTLYTWRHRYLNETGKHMPKSSNHSKILSTEAKFLAVVETSTLSETERNQYCREKGIYPEQLSQWRKACMKANESASSKASSAEAKRYQKQIKKLEKELKYKEKALSEAAALLVLRKKLHALWEEGSEED